jgi:hypothetical protein
MKTQEMFATLAAFAELAEGCRAQDLRAFAGIFRTGKEEMVAARVKRIASHWKTSSDPQNHPAALRKSLIAIEAGLTASGAKKQVADIATILSLFAGPGTSSLDSFIERITGALTAPPATKARPRTAPQAPDQALASQLADELAAAVLDADAFEKVAERLRNSKLVSTPTLAAVANRFLGNTKSYKGRKSALDDIMNRQKQDARSYARGKALDRIGV